MRKLIGIVACAATLVATQPVQAQPAERSLSFIPQPAPVTDALEVRVDHHADNIARLQERIDRLTARMQTQRNRRDAVTARIAAEPEPTQQELWDAGYLAHGGQHLDVFHTIILPCESGGEPDPFRAIGHVDPRDRGRAQINAGYWGARFTELTELDFYGHIFDPWLNGMMAAVVEQEQGLWAWVCYNKRR